MRDPIRWFKCKLKPPKKDLCPPKCENKALGSENSAMRAVEELEIQAKACFRNAVRY